MSRADRKLRRKTPPQPAQGPAPPLKVTISMPAHRTVECSTVISLGALLRHETERGTKINFRIVRNSLLHFSRDELARNAMEDGAEWILWIDADMTFPPWTLERFLSHRKPFVAANCVRRRSPYTWTAMRENERVVTTAESTGLEEVSIIGLAVALTHVDVFLKTPRPWFDMPWRENLVDVVGEDLYFCHKYQKAFGEGPMIDHDVSKLVSHIGDLECGLDMANLYQKLDGREK